MLHALTLTVLAGLSTGIGGLVAALFRPGRRAMALCSGFAAGVMLAMSLLDKDPNDCFAIGFPKDSPYYETFNNTLKEMMENGELDSIIASHLSEEFIAD